MINTAGGSPLGQVISVVPFLVRLKTLRKDIRNLQEAAWNTRGELASEWNVQYKVRSQIVSAFASGSQSIFLQTANISDE